MKRIINLAFLLFSFTLFSQSEKVNFENELTYTYTHKYTNSDNKRFFMLYVSKKQPNLILKKYEKKIDPDYLYYRGNYSDYSLDENNEIEYEKLLFMNIQNKINKVVKSKEKEIINGFECEKYILDSEYQIFVVFITNKSEINNTEYLRHLFIVDDEDSYIFNSGLIVKISNYSSATEQPYILELSDIKKSKKSIIVDFEKFNLKSSKLGTDDSFDVEVEVIEQD